MWRECLGLGLEEGKTNDDLWNAAQLQPADGECVAASEERNTDLFKAVPMR